MKTTINHSSVYYPVNTPKGDIKLTCLNANYNNFRICILENKRIKNAKDITGNCALHMHLKVNQSLSVVNKINHENFEYIARQDGIFKT